MIAWLRGALRARGEDGRVVIDVGGVGYAVQVPLGVTGQAALGDTVELHIHTNVREDQIALYGFEDETQVETFHALIGVSKVGPKLAINVLGGITPGELAAAVDGGDIARLTTISGVGKRLAERLTVELRGKLKLTTSDALTGSRRHGAEPQTLRDLRSALVNLQYRPKEIDAVLAQLREQEPPETPFDALLRKALGLLRR